MKKILIALLVLSMVFCFAACGKDDGGAGVASPMTDYDSLEALNEAAGTNLSLPAGMEVTEEAFATVSLDEDVIAQYMFKLNDYAYTLRCSATIFDQDISGVYINGEPAFFDETPSETEANYDDSVKVGRWVNIDGQFTLMVEDEGQMDIEEFVSILNDFVEHTNPAIVGSEVTEYFAALDGEWQDQTSQRAMLDVKANETGAEFTVSWGSSASETTTWTMNVTVAEDGLIYYNDCTKINHIFDEDGEETVEIIYTDGSGNFELGSEDGYLYWTGAEEEECATCVFVK